MKQQMVRLSVEVSSGAARFRVGVQAKSVRKALAIVGGRYPHGEVRMAFPTQPENFIVSEPSTPASIAGAGQTHAAAA